MPKEKLKYEVVSYGSTGIFGLVGTKKAKIRIVLPEPDSAETHANERLEEQADLFQEKRDKTEKEPNRSEKDDVETQTYPDEPVELGRVVTGGDLYSAVHEQDIHRQSNQGSGYLSQVDDVAARPNKSFDRGFVEGSGRIPCIIVNGYPPPSCTSLYVGTKGLAHRLHRFRGQVDTDHSPYVVLAKDRPADRQLSL